MALAAALLVNGSSVVVTAVAGVVAGLVAAAGLLVGSVRAARRSRRHRASSLRRLAFGSIIWLTGEGVRPIAEGTPFVLTFADVLLLVGVLLLAFGCGSTARRTAYGRSLLHYAAGAYVGAASLFTICWVTLLAPVYAKTDEPGSLASPVVCLLATCAVAPAVLASRSPERRVGLGALGVLAAITVQEFATSVGRAAANGEPSLIVGMLAPVAFLLLAVTPWSGRARPRRGWPAAVVDAAPLALVAVATVVVAVRVMTGGPGPWTPALPLVAGSVVLVLLVKVFVLDISTASMRGSLESGERQLVQLAENAGDVVLVVDLDGVIREMGAGVEAMYGYRSQDLLGQPVYGYVHSEDVPAIQAALRAMAVEEDADRPGACRIDCRVRAADGTWRPAESVATRHPREGEDLVLISTRDVSDQVALRNQVAHLTFHDGVTGLPNRAYFEERTREVLARRGASRTAVIFMDLDGFTGVNDSVGHASGDYLLSQAARRLRAAVSTDDTLARWGGDEFALLLESGGSGSADAQSAIDLAERLLRAVSTEPFRVADRDIALTASVGVAFAEDGLPAGDLIRNADVAMTRAKEHGGRRVEVFAAHMHADVVRRLELAADLQRALLAEQFAVEYQPVVDLATSRITAVEALVRWWSGGAFVPPQQFLGAAEDTGLIVPLGEWILREACREVAAWRASSSDIGLSLNLSSRQITAPRFVETVEAALADSGLPASALTLEVIEEMLVEDAEEVIERLGSLRALGVRLAIDDFGTGYASLALLRTLPVDMIKIDPSFVSGLGSDEALTLLTRTIVRLGHDLGLTVVAEGIERPEQLELLREMGCSRGQGYLVARPMAPRGVDTLMRTDCPPLQNTA
ncbi:putative bifunctional diguanylate cyclase/phosphodiesterase [Sphaerisporangium siamense]|uniref:Diguanylate cyclase (GGDEF)-like protein/PAS domain S-box-containing protein n=1 Tax=Sphaerisporangium siamense TaxID=795645 RepID=A0A7W7G825_9ACTN|nr:GGDEF domain-containing phosphodiesterase [Sphaerisporangium siamense]MBB4701273.1 diguanylate cyclase (GGDEF)-like protein/PAS domain S-box-containing protein [Sphaerisporangium siamense]